MRQIAFMMSLLLIASIVIAQPVAPLPLAIKIDSLPNTNLPVKVTNLRSGEILQGNTNQYGEFIAEWANSVNKYAYGDVFRIEVLDRIQEWTYYGSPPEGVFHFNLDLACSIQKDLEYGEELRVFDEECNVQVKARAYQPVVCYVDAVLDYDQEFLEINDECNVKIKSPPKPDLTAYAIAAIIVFIAAYLYGRNSSLKLYQGNDGNVKIAHKHPGIIEYHNPNIVHRKEAIRHKKGEFAPKYVKDSNGNWKYAG